MWFSRLWHRASGLYSASVSDKYTASIFRVEMSDDGEETYLLYKRCGSNSVGKMGTLVPSYQNARRHNMKCFPRKPQNSQAYYVYCRQGQARYRRLTAGAQFQSSVGPCGFYGELILTGQLSASTLSSSPFTTPSMFHAQLPSGIGESYTSSIQWVPGLSRG